MKISATTYSGNKVLVEKRPYRKAIKAYLLKGQKPLTDSDNPDSVLRYLRAKNASFHHALDRAEIYSMKIHGRKVFVL